MLSSLILGDCLQTLQNLPSESVDLCYIDPPFFSNRNYEVIWGDKGEVRSFEDRWSGGVDHYIGWLKERVQEIHRILKPTGSFYLHCDWHADAYIRVYILDKIFGEGNFRNMITWKRRTGTNSSVHNPKQFGQNIDTIYFYSKSKQWNFNGIYSFEDEKYRDYVDKFFKFTDENGRKYRVADLSNPAPRPNLMYEYKGYKPPKNGWAISLKKMEQFEKEGRLHFPTKKDGRIQRRRFLDELKGNPIQAMWDDIDIVSAHSTEKIGYPTQKPEALLERIIKASSNEGDVVLDCFVGGGTTVAVADRLGRKWIGIDQSVQAIKVSEFRLNRQKNLFSEPFEVRLHKYDYDQIRQMDPFKFEHFIAPYIGGVANTKQRGDGGFDGRTKDNVPIQVKRSDAVGGVVVRQFITDARSFDRKLFDQRVKNGEVAGKILAFSFGKGAFSEVAKFKNEDGIILELITIDSLVPMAKKPNVKLVVELLEKKEKSENYKFEIKATAGDGSQIEFYSFEIWQEGKTGNKNSVQSQYAPMGAVPKELGSSASGVFLEQIFLEQILSDSLNKTGQIEQELKHGKYKIIGRAIDNDGLEGEDSVEVVVG